MVGALLPLERKENGHIVCRTKPQLGAHTRGHVPLCPPFALLLGPPRQCRWPNPAGVLPGASPLPPAAWPSASTSSETQCQLSECSLPYSRPPPAPASHQGRLCLCVSLCQRATSPLPRKLPQSAPGNPQPPHFPLRRPHRLASPTDSFCPVAHSFRPGVHAFVRYLLSVYSAGRCSQHWDHRTESPSHPEPPFSARPVRNGRSFSSSDSGTSGRRCEQRNTTRPVSQTDTSGENERRAEAGPVMTKSSAHSQGSLPVASGPGCRAETQHWPRGVGTQRHHGRPRGLPGHRLCSRHLHRVLAGALNSRRGTVPF